jgi:hypothetical protein
MDLREQTQDYVQSQGFILKMLNFHILLPESSYLIPIDYKISSRSTLNLVWFGSCEMNHFIK